MLCQILINSHIYISILAFLELIPLANSFRSEQKQLNADNHEDLSLSPQYSRRYSEPVDMLSAVNSFLDFDRGCIPDGECLAIGQKEENGCFFLHQVVSAALKEKKPVCLVSFVQKFHHYSAVSQKIGGASLQPALEAKQLLFYDGLEDLLQTFFTDVSNPKTDSANFLGVLKERLLKSLTSLRENNQTEPVLVIDELSVLLSIGFHVQDVRVFVKSLYHEALGFGTGSDAESLPKSNGTSVAVLCSHDEHDKDSTSLWNFLAAQSSVVVNVSGLQTGYCKDVHGQVTNHTNVILQFNTSRLLYHY